MRALCTRYTIGTRRLQLLAYMYVGAIEYHTFEDLDIAPSAKLREMSNDADIYRTKTSLSLTLRLYDYTYIALCYNDGNVGISVAFGSIKQQARDAMNV